MTWWIIWGLLAFAVLALVVGFSLDWAARRALAKEWAAQERERQARLGRNRRAPPAGRGR